MTTRAGKLFATTALYLIPIGAMAADLPVRAAAPAPVMTVLPFSWTGFYVGLQAGWQGFQTDVSVNAPFFVSPVRGSADSSGFVGGAHAGFNYQLNSIVLGLEADIEYASGDKRFSPAMGFFAPAGENGFDWGPQVQGSVRARLGFAVDRVLFYATGGVAFLSTSTTYFNTLFQDFQKADRTYTGWTLGAGVEYAFTNNWSARIEYRYTDFGDSSRVPLVGSGQASYTKDLTSNAVRVGVSYRFGGSSTAPVVARY